jgi:hypothetical protein
MSDKTWSPMVCAVCDVTSTLMAAFLIGGTAYAVFWHGASGWWFLLTGFFLSCITCKHFRSPEQIAADKGETVKRQ